MYANLKFSLAFLLAMACTGSRAPGRQKSAETSPRSSFTIFTIGDSTMADKKAETAPETGWCQAFRDYTDTGILLKNCAVNGRSSKSFIDEKRWKAVADSLKEGDYVFIQFGHNDEKIQDSTRYAEPATAYRSNLARFVRETREHGATPILFTSIVRRKFENGLLADTHKDYPVVVRQLAAEMMVPLVDLELLTAGAVTALGEEDSKKIYLWTPPSGKFPAGRKDDTHLSREGADLVARLAATQLVRMNNTLAGRIR